MNEMKKPNKASHSANFWRQGGTVFKPKMSEDEKLSGFMSQGWR